MRSLQPPKPRSSRMPTHMMPTHLSKTTQPETQMFQPQDNDLNCWPCHCSNMRNMPRSM
jgi:hypothetical protein